MTYVAHWDDVQARRLDVGALRARWQDLGRAAGMTAASVKREVIDPGCRPTPVHAHGRDEEFFFVQGGQGLSWQDGVTHEVGPGDCLLHPAEGAAHTLIAGDEGLEVLVFGPESRTSGTRLPRAGVFWHGPWWIADDAGEARPFEREPEELEGTPPHVHSAEHEIFVVLDGGGDAVIGEESFPLRRGSVVGRPAGTGVAHAFHAGAAGLTYLAWSTRDPNDLVFQPRSGKVIFRGLGIIARVEQAAYWDGEAQA